MTDEEEVESQAWCHIYPQYIWHSHATIEGTRAALVAIRDAIDKALSTGMDAHSDALYAADGEGYAVAVKIRNIKHLEGSTLPYSAHFAGGIGASAYENGVRDDREMKAAMRASKRKAAVR